MKEPVIMCVDDEEIVLRSLQRELNDALDHSYIIETATGGEDALELFDELLQEGHEIPLTISDHIMPDMKGDELFRCIHTRSPKTLKIMLTGQADMEAVTNALNAADLYRYIAKPWETTDLLLTVKEALRRYFQEKQLAQQNTILQNMNTLLEQQVKVRTAELETQKIELEEKNRQLQEANGSKDKFFSIIAHDLKNPFSTLLGFTDLILENAEIYQPDELKQDVLNLQASAKKVYTLLNNLLTWSRIQRGVMKYTPILIDIGEIIQENIYLVTPKAEQKQIVLKTSVLEQTMVYADYDMVNTIIRNLLSNALKFTPPGGKISFSAQQNGHMVEVTITDTGIGISEHALTQLFRIDAHYTRPGTDGEQGTGLGLILCKDLVEKNSGSVWAESRVGEGTTFTFTLPIPMS